MRLHEAIEQVLKVNGHPMTSREIADAVNEGKLFSKSDKQPVEASQISARVCHYRDLFEKKDGKIMLT